MPQAPRLNQVKAFLIDLDGTVYLGDHLIAGAARFMHLLQQRGIKSLFLTNNSSNNARTYAEKLTLLGLPTSPTQVLTSGEATAIYLEHIQPGARVFLVGTPALQEDFEAHGFSLTAADPQWVVLGFDTSLTYAKMWRLCSLVSDRLPYLATHPDTNCPIENGYMPEMGPMIAYVREATGRMPDEIIGKPNRLIGETALERLGVSRQQVCMLGDRFTDLQLAENLGITSILVLSGETSPAEVDSLPAPPDYVFADIGSLADFLSQQDI